jgi:Ulp1 family protease
MEHPESFKEYLELVRSSMEFQKNVLRIDKQLQELGEIEGKIRAKMVTNLMDVVFGPIPPSALKPKPKPPRPRYMCLCDEDGVEADLILATCCEGDGTVIADKNNIEITRDKAACLHPRQWLNDEVINFYFALISDKYPSTYAWNSFFWLKLSGDGNGYNYKAVQRWTSRKKIDLFSFRRILVPMNIGKNHWALGVLDLEHKEIKYFDSLAEGSIHKSFAQYMKRYLKDEWKDKNKDAKIEMPDFDSFTTPQVFPPQQCNSFDCGVFTCMCGECIAGERDWFDYDQK